MSKRKTWINYIRGAISAFDLWPVANRPACLSDYEAALADYNALRSDWEAVGGDIRQAMQSFQQELTATGVDGMTDQRNHEHGASR